MILTIDCSNEGESCFEIEVSLENTSCLFTFDWNDREGRWYVSLDGVLSRAKVVCSYPIFKRARYKGGPPGLLFFRSSNPEGAPPGFNDLGTSVRFVYVTSDDPLLVQAPETVIASAVVIPS